MTIDGRGVGEFFDVGPVGGFQQGFEGGIACGPGHPGGDGAVGVVFDDDEGTAVEFFEEGQFVLYIMKRVGHKEAVEVGGEGDGDEVAADGDEGDAVDAFAVEGGPEVDAIDGAAFGKEAGEGFGKEAGATAEVGPALGALV